MSSFDISGWDSKYVSLQVKTTQSPVLETKRVDVSSVMGDLGYVRYHDFKRGVFRISNAGQMEPVMEETWCFTNPSTGDRVAVSSGKIEIVSERFDDLENLCEEFDKVKKLLHPILSFSQVVGIFHRAVYTTKCDQFPTEKLKPEYLGSLSGRETEHFHSEFKYWEDTDSASTPGRLSIHLKGAKRHAAFADGIEYFTQQIMQSNFDVYDDYTGGYSLDVYENSDAFSAIGLDQPSSSMFHELHERMMALASEVVADI